MKIKYQIALTTTIIYLLIMIIDLLFIKPRVLSSFADIENKNLIDNVKAIRNSIVADEQDLDALVKDWAFWDDTYDFIVTGNKAYLKSNITDSTFTDQGLDFILYFDNRGKLVFGKYFDHEKKKQVPLESRFLSRVEDLTNGPGIITINDKIYMLAKEPILTSENTGPSRGSLVMGRRMDNNIFHPIAPRQATRIEWTYLDELSKDKIKEIEGRNGIAFYTINDELVSGYILFRDSSDRPSILVRIIMKREVFLQGLKTIRSITLIIVATFIFMLFLAVFSYEFVTMPRFQLIIDTIDRIKHSNDFSKRIPLGRYDRLIKDEITSIMRYINEFISIISDLYEKQKHINETLESKIKERTEELEIEIEQRKTTESELKDREQRFREMAENIRDGLLIIEEKSPVFVNRRLREMMGVQDEELTMEHFWKLVEPECLETIRDFFSQAKQGKNIFDTSFWIKRDDGKRRYIHVSYFKFEPENRSSRIYLTFTDITSQKIIEERYRSVVENAHEAILVLQGGKIRFINSKAIEAVGYSGNDIQNTDFLNFIHPDDYETVNTLYNIYRREGKIPETVVRIVKRDGSILWVEANVTKITWEEKDAALVFLNDITAQKTAEAEKEKLSEQLYQIQKLSSIQNLAGGIAHDLNNILTPVLGFTDLAMTEFQNPPQLMEYLINIKNNTHRAADLIKKLLAFSRKQFLLKESIDLNKLINELSPILERLIEENIVIHYALSEDLPPIKADKNQLEQVIINLTSNARDAMPSGGTLTISTSMIEPDDDFHRKYPEAEKEKYVSVSISDTGIGMDSETLNNIFEPFFTTKEFGQGSGLGLSVVYGIVKQHGGIIDVKSSPGKGTTVEIFFPAALPDVVSEKVKKIEEKETISFIDGKGKKILVVEDEEVIRSFIKNVLEKQNFEVKIAKNSKEAEREFLESPQSYSLLITDLVLPDISGLDLISRLHTIRPDLPCLISSGYSTDSYENSLLENERVKLLKKPFTLSELNKVMSSLIDL